MSMPTPHGVDDHASESSSPVTPPHRPQPRGVSLTRFGRRLLAFAAISLAIGVAAGLIWHVVVDLPVYVVGTDGSAASSERGLTEVFGTDAHFAVVAVVGGLLLGLLGHFWFARRGWISAVIVALGALVAAVTAWRVGIAQGPGNFSDRMGQAKPNDHIPIDFALHTLAVLYLWPFFALIPVLVISAFGPELPDN